MIERLHLRVRAVAEHCKRLSDYESTVLSGVVNDHSRRCQSGTFAHCSMGRTRDFPDLQGAFVSDAMDFGGIRAAVGDFVFNGDDECGNVVACALEQGELFALVDLWSKVSIVSPHSAIWTPAGRRCVWSVSNISECSAWLHRPNDEVLVVRM